MKRQAEIDIKRLQSGWSPNEIRGQYDMPAVEGGDDHYVGTNLAVAGSDKLKGIVSDSGLVRTNPEPAVEEGGEA